MEFKKIGIDGYVNDKGIEVWFDLDNNQARVLPGNLMQEIDSEFGDLDYANSEQLYKLVKMLQEKIRNMHEVENYIINKTNCELGGLEDA